MGASESFDGRASCPLCRSCHSPGLRRRSSSECNLNVYSPQRARPNVIEEDVLGEFSRLLRRADHSGADRRECEAGWWTQSGFGEEGRKRALAYNSGYNGGCQDSGQTESVKKKISSPLSPRQQDAKGIFTFLFDDYEKRQEKSRQQEAALAEAPRLRPQKLSETDKRKAVLQDVTHEYFLNKYFFDRPETPRSPTGKQISTLPARLYDR